MKNNKKALSEVIGYVLIILIGISVAGMVGFWLKAQVPTDNSEELCPEGSSVIISYYNCTRDEFGNLKLNITLKNKGFFRVDGFILKFNNKADGKIGIYSLCSSSLEESCWGRSLVPDESFNFEYLLTNSYEGKNTKSLIPPGQEQKVYLLEVQPFTLYNSEKNFCEKISYKEINKAICN